MRLTKREYLMQLLFPPRCIICGEVVPIGKACCERCRGEFAQLRLRGDDNELLGAPGRADKYLDGVCASFVYRAPISEAVARYKFHGERTLAREFALFMAEDFERVYEGFRCDIALGAPSFEKRNDHAEGLALECARLLGIKYGGGVLIKARKTKKQHELGAVERASNLKGAFEVKRPATVRGKAVLLVDDVTTSGETLNECARALKNAGAAAVLALALCATEKRI